MSTTVIPRAFCWTRFGTEAGQAIGEILRRKESERLRNGGLFLWGIGNALGPSIRALVEDVHSPEVIFSPIRSRAREADSCPDEVVRWTGALDLMGNRVKLPSGSMVISRISPKRPKTKHYALVCQSDEPLDLQSDGPRLDLATMCNYVSGRKVGASQVTAVVRIGERRLSKSEARYPVAIKASLVSPYFLELIDPVLYRSASDLTSSAA